MRLSDELGRALLDAGAMAWQITWSLILGFTLSAVISFGRVVSFIFADLIIIPILIIYRKYYGTRMMLALLGIFYAAMVAGGYIIEFAFGGLGLVPADRAARITGAGITWNYTTILNIIFLLIAAALVVRFVRSGSAPMLKMMGGSPDQHRYTCDHQDGMAEPSTCMAPVPTVRSRG